MIPNTVGGNALQRVVERLNPNLAEAPVILQSHVVADTIPESCKPRVVDLQQEPSVDNGLVFHSNSIGNGVDEFLR